MNAQNLRTLLKETDEKLSIFTNFEILNKYNMNEQEIFDLIREFLNDKQKIALFNCKHFQGLESKLIESISDENIKIMVLKTILKKRCHNKYEKEEIFKKLDTKTIVQFLKDNRDSENKMQPYEIVSSLYSDKQKEIVSMLENMDFLTPNEKKEILVFLNGDVKQFIKSGNFPQEYKNIIKIPTKMRMIPTKDGRDYKKEVLFEFDSEIKLETYRGLDKLIRPIFAEELTEQEKIKFMELCDICPNLRVISSLNNKEGLASTGAEYKKAEEWITSVINNLDDNYSEAQKIAVIDNAIGKKISYSLEL